MGNASDALEVLIGNHLLRSATWSKPANLYLALFTTMPVDAGTGGVEVSGGSYARVAVGPGDSYWTPPTPPSDQYTNTGAINFPNPSANWGTVVGCGIFDASSGGTLLVLGTLTSPRTINNGDPTPNFPIGAFQLSIS